MFTSRDVARLANVSQSTVSYVMSGKRPISEKTRKRVEAAIEQLTYQPNAGARALASQRTRVIGLAAPFGPAADATGLLPFIETITSSVREHDHDLLLVTADEGSAGLNRLCGRSLVDAIVLMEIEAEDERVTVAAGLRVPVILIGVPDDPKGLPCVDVDFAMAGRMAVEELVATGHDRIVVLPHPKPVVDRGVNYVQRFLDGVAAGASAAGRSYELLSAVETTGEGAEAAVDQVLASGDRVGVVMPHGAAVQTVLRELARRGVVLGQDASVVAVLPDAAAEAVEPPVTNVSLEPRDVSRRAVQILFRLLDGDPASAPGGIELVPPRLTRRDTSPHP